MQFTLTAPLVARPTHMPPRKKNKLLFDFTYMDEYVDLFPSLDSELVIMCDKYSGIISPWLSIGAYPSPCGMNDCAEDEIPSFITVIRSESIDELFAIIADMDDRFKICEEHQISQNLGASSIETSLSIPLCSLLDTTGAYGVSDMISVIEDVLKDHKSLIKQVDENTEYFKQKFGYVMIPDYMTSIEQKLEET
jgi:hypothetical protein